MIGAAAAHAHTHTQGRATVAAAVSPLRRLAAHLPALAVYAAGAAMALALKTYASHANATDLRVVLAPTCWLAARLGGISFSDEGAAGFISHGEHLVVGTACSGANFFVVCFGALFYSFAQRWRTLGSRIGWLLASLALAWTATVATNAVRVVAAAHLYQADIYGDWLTPSRVHRLLGVLLYCASLVIVHGAVARWWASAAEKGSRLARLLGSPIAWYLGIAVMVPLVRRAPQGRDVRLAEHVAVILGVILIAVGLKVIAKRLAIGLQSKAWRGASAR
jgi:exosortase K